MMSSTSMYGVVLWSDADERKAVIWCEDQGNLAFYTPGDKSALEGVSLDAGDLIQFDVREEQNMRFAKNPQLVGQSQYPGIADRLNASPARPANGPGVHSNVISMKRYSASGRSAVLA